MSTATAVTMQDLEFEHAELLPARETLSMYNSHPSSSFNVTQVVNNGNGNGNHNGNGDYVFGLGNIVGSGNGNLNGNGNITIQHVF